MYQAQLHHGKWHARSFGMSAVFIKTLTATANRATLEREFVWELKLLMVLEHKNIIRLAGFTTAASPRWRLIVEVGGLDVFIHCL